jgi:hypothetical protein
VLSLRNETLKSRQWYVRMGLVFLRFHIVHAQLKLS